jgi:hypothetical protein
MPTLARSAWLLISILICCFGLLPKAQSVSPAPDGGYPGGNTAEGQNAFLSLMNGTYNTAVGFLSLESNTTGPFNTAVGAVIRVYNFSFARNHEASRAVIHFPSM